MRMSKIPVEVLLGCVSGFKDSTTPSLLVVGLWERMAGGPRESRDCPETWRGFKGRDSSRGEDQVGTRPEVETRLYPSRLNFSEC